MTILDWVLILLGAAIALPILAFLIMRGGTVGYFRGKEVSKQNEFVNSVQDNDNETES
jgi:hypothetical protein